MRPLYNACLYDLGCQHFMGCTGLVTYMHHETLCTLHMLLALHCMILRY